MRRARITSENGGFYHIISRIIECRRILGDQDQFGSKRAKGACPMAWADWGGLCTMRNFQLELTG